MMFVTAPMGVMQQVQPLPAQPSLTPQVVPAAQRELASAVSGLVSALATNPDRKQSPQTQTPQSSAPRTASNTPAPVTPESWLLQEVPDEAPGQTTFRVLSGTQPQQRSLQTGNAGFAAQLLAQEDMAEVALPQTPNVADMLKRLVESRTATTAAQVTDRTANTLSMLAVPPSTLNTVVRRDTYGSVLMPRGASAYQQAQLRLVKPEAPRPVAEEDAAIDETEAA